MPGNFLKLTKQIKKPTKFRMNIVTDVYTVIFSFLILVALASRMELALREEDKQALYFLASIGISFGLYLSFFDIVPFMIKKFIRRSESNIEIPVKVLVPIVVALLVQI